MPPFNPFDLRPLASLNRRSLIALPGLETEYVGNTATELISKQTLIARIRQQAHKLGLEQCSDHTLPTQLNLLLDSPDHTIRSVAETIATAHGRLLGYLFASIMRSEHGLASPPDVWEQDYLAYWRSHAQQIILGGGLANGLLGTRIAAAAKQALHASGFTERSVHAAANPSYLPLIGAARSIAVPGPAVVADFGGTHAKRGIARFDTSGALDRLQLLPDSRIEAFTEGDSPTALAEVMAELIAEALMLAGPSAAPHVVCSIGAYVENRQPMRINRGAYTALHRVSSDLPGWFAERIAAHCGKHIQLEFVHDCDIAACAYAGYHDTAVVMLGSALGVGFAPPADGYRALANRFMAEQEFSMPPDLVRLSKFLSLVLRHDPGKIGITLDPQGWIEVSTLLEAAQRHGVQIEHATLLEVVRTNDKQRFALSEDEKRIRASQGHSIEIDLALEPIAPPELLYHGTATRFLDSIQREGLQKRSRQHVHLSPDHSTAVKVGQRHGKPAVLIVRAGVMAAAGFLFYRSANGVWLTDHVPPEYLEFP